MSAALESRSRYPSREHVVPTLCHGCSYGGYNCGILAHVRDGVMTRVEGNPEHPLNRGRLCAKGLAATQWVYNPQRLTQPLMRRGARGSGRFEAISWDEALQMITKKISETREVFGPEYILLCKGQAAGWFGLHHLLMLRFLHALGSPNFTSWGPYVCYGPQLFYHRLTVGGPTYTRPDYDNADLILEWFTGGGQGGAARGGVETLDTNLRSVPKKILDRLEKGAKLIVINPQLIPLAANGRAHRWLPIRPGTDAALALAMIHVILQRGMYDRDFVSEWCAGFDELAAHVRSCTPEWAEALTGIPASEIASLAVEYATTPRAAIRVSEAPQKAGLQAFATAVPMLVALTGHLDRPGGNVWFRPAARLGFDVLPERVSKEARERVLGGESFYVRSHGKAFAHFPDVVQALIEARPYRPRVMLIYGSNPVSTGRPPGRVAEALSRLEFLVQFDVTLNPTAWFADLVLPAATRYECADQPCLWDNHLALSRQVVPPHGNCRDELDVTLDLACRLGMGSDFWDGDRDAMLHDFLKPSGVALDTLRETGKEGLFLPPRPDASRRERYAAFFKGLPGGRVQLWNKQLAEAGFDPMPTYRGEPEDLLNTPELQRTYPLLFTDEHSDPLSHHSWMRDVPWLRELRPDPCVKVHPDTAATCGLSPGDWVEVTSPRSRMKARVEVFEGVRRDTVLGQHGWWQGCSHLGLAEQLPFEGGVNPNVLYDADHRDPITANTTKNTLVHLKKCQKPGSAHPGKSMETSARKG
ncbi:molybdopterin-containing oxidoreductase family protein [Desulfatiglans anilini]|uniref:molybdopterin-containing oxidoreductase family protein n=1 Tax=Desulfatiglans anilini TaxID=90728 RepID=UPI00040D7FBB|nr:molybdopterin-dependent oxidoreductase [Desulfatiglans anilini]